MPLPDVEGAVAEVEYALDTLHADGVILLTNYEGVYLGEKKYAPLWEALDERSALVFIHPGAPALKVLEGIPGPVIDYPFDTTRTAVHMIMNTVLDRCPATKVILSHAGGFLPYASHRFAELLSALNSDGPTVDTFLAGFGQFYFDTALSAGPAALPGLVAFAGSHHILYGSDFPYAPASVGASFTAKLDAYSELAGDEHAAINNGNARKLLARLSA